MFNPDAPDPAVCMAGLFAFTDLIIWPSFVVIFPFSPLTVNKISLALKALAADPCLPIWKSAAVALLPFESRFT